MAITVTERAASEVRRILSEQQPAPGTPEPTPEKIYLRMRVVGGGCSGFQHKLDLDPTVNPKLDETFEFHGVPVVVDKRSMMYLGDATVDFHDDLNRRGFSITNPSRQEHLRLRQLVLDVIWLDKCRISIGSREFSRLLVSYRS